MDIKKHLEVARFLTRLLDTRFSFLGIRFGIDPLLSLIPGIGSIMGSATSVYILWIGLKENLPKEVFIRMIFNILIDFILGAIPAVGVVLDVFYKSNIRNLKLLEDVINLTHRRY